MVETISPVVHGGNRKRYRRTLAAHVAGAAATSAGTGLLLGALGAVLGAPWSPWSAVLVVCAAVVWAAGALGVPVPVPQAGRQVPEWWRTFFSPGVAAFLYGAGLGLGFPFRLGYGTLAVVAVGCVALGDPVAGALCFGAFGLARGVSVAAGSAGDDEVVDRLGAVGSGRIVPAVNGLVLTAVCLAALSA